MLFLSLSIYKYNLDCCKCFHKLDCGHTYHYECILKTYTHNRIKTQCPLCRKNGGLLPLVNGIKKIYNKIHKIDSDNPYENIMCNAILKTGKNKGNVCGKYCKLGYFQCNRHFK